PAPTFRRPGRGRRTWGQRLLIAVMGSASIVALGAAGLVWELAHLAGQVQRVPVGAVLDRPGRDGEAAPASTPLNFLLVGVDGTGGTRQDIAGPRGVLSDSIMVVRLYPATRSVEVLPLPRDLWVAIPGHGEAKINAAIASGAADDP